LPVLASSDRDKAAFGSCAWYFLLASVVGYARAFFVRSRRVLEGLSGGAMIAFGLKLASD
jgi:threonine/homoserine/homoserine lactone efflux protein